MHGHGLVDRLVGRVDRARARGADHVRDAKLVGDGGRGGGNERVAAAHLQRVKRIDGRDLAVALLHHRLEVLVEDFLLLVGNLEEALVDVLELLVGEDVAQLGEAVAQRRVAGAGREDDLRAGGAHIGRVDDLVGVAGLEHAVLVDARAVGEGVGAHDGLVGLHVDAGDGAHELARARELGRHDVGVGVELGLVHADGHDDLLERGVAGALAQAVDGALDLGGAVAHALEGERRGHAEVVVRVHRDGDVLDAVHALAQVADARAELPGHVVAGGVRDVHDRGSGLHRRLDDANEEVLLGAASVLGVELDVVHEAASVLHRMDSALDGLVLGEVQLVAQVGRRDAQARVDARALCALQSLGRDLDVLVNRASQAADGALVTRELADLGHALEVARARNGKARLDDVDVHAHELARDDELLLGVHAGARRLLAVTQGGVENGDLAAHGFLRFLGRGMCFALTSRGFLGPWQPAMKKHPSRRGFPKGLREGC